MNYGKEFIKLYNKELSAFKKEIIERIEKDYGSPEMANDLYSRYRSEIQGKIIDIKENDNKEGKETSLTGMSLGYMNKEYKFDRVENIINRDIYKYFLDNEKYAQYKDFSHFLQYFSKFLVLHSYSSFISENLEFFYSVLDQEKVNDFFDIKYIKDDLNVLVLSKEQSEILKAKNKKSIASEEPVEKAKIKVDNIKLNKENYDNPFTENEKFILIHYLFKHERSQENKLSAYEVTLILKMSCEAFTNKKLNKVKDTTYEKYHGGYDYYSVSKNKKKNNFKIVIEKCKVYKLNSFAEYLNHELFKM
ncbi:hypothetical protein [uncultured Tenacibaculum sp.]|uniref:hypothetical protein n=1 Tax=uncultured Tenacibaculum sp. TaxID=174713 RepID=UPI002625D453|nr:hypothetical protein [uncultured Tenacibaculum sp.]